MADTISINGKDIPPGKTAQINLNVAKLPTHTMIDLPVYVFRGKRDGPKFLITAGLHGDELNGVETIRRLIVNNAINPQAGTVVAVPIINVYGFLNNSRYLPDGRDLNRSFPGTNSGSLASRIAHTVMNKIVPMVDFGVDFHTGGANSNFPQIRCAFDVPENMELAQAFSPPYIINSKLRDYSFRKAAHKAGKSILVFEGGESLRFDENAIKEGMNGIIRLMSAMKMTDSTPPESNDTVMLTSTTWIRARSSGLYRVFMECGSTVKRNQVIASITDPFGETEYKIKSGSDGYVIGLRSLPVVNRGDALINIGIRNKGDSTL
jgi:hypothetical protein